MTRFTTMNLSSPVGQAFWGLRIIFTIAPIAFGVDKFFNILVDWPKYLAPWIPGLIHVTPQVFMYGIGIVEIAAGILVALWPEIFAYVIMLWLWGIIINLLTIAGYYDVALRDFGLSIGALALGRLAWAHRQEKLGKVELARGHVGAAPRERTAA